MTQVRRANVILTIKDDQVERFLDMGYDVIDEKGDIVQKSAPKSVEALSEALDNSQKKIAELEKEIEALKKARKTTAQKKSDK